MDIQLRKVGPAVIVEIDGALGAGESEKAFERGTGQLIDRGERLLVLDLSRMPRIDSMGLGRMVQMLVRMRSRGGAVRLVAPTPFVRNVLMITKLTTVFEIHESMEHALAAQTLSA